MDYAQLVSDCETEIRAGRPQEAARRLGQLNGSKVPRLFRLPLANACRRTGLVKLGLRLLTPIVQPASAQPFDATLAEQAEYAVLLQRSGAVREAMEMMQSIPSEQLPEVSLSFCSCLFNLWEYEAAIPHLESYIARGPVPYMTMVAQTNLAAALIFVGRANEAAELLNGLIQRAEEQSAHRLRANCLEMLAQIDIGNRRFSQAEEILDQAAKLLEAAGTHDQLFVLKWKAVAEANRSGSIAALIEFRKHAVARGESEAVRDADLFSLSIDYNEERFERLYFGTPYAPYRARMCRILKREPPARPSFFGDPHASGLNLTRPTSKIDFILLALLQDFYRPQQVGTLFTTLFPEEHFNIFTSPGRVRQAIFRARKWLTQNSIPATLREIDGRYSLELSAPFRIDLPASIRKSETDHKLDELRKYVSHLPEFSVQDAQKALQVSPATCKRLLSRAVAVGELIRFGAGSATRYFFPSETEKSA